MFSETLSFLESLKPEGAMPQLGPMREAVRIFGHPQQAFPSIHICGTNGKGSTGAFLNSIFMEQGSCVGFHTSPHLMSILERIQISGRQIDEDDFIAFAEKIKEGLPDKKLLSYFEFLVLMTFLVFRDRCVDMAIVETGLGGRLDATNVLSPLVTVITPISYDHMQFLGPRLTDIAREKCGTVKPGVPVVSALQPDEVMQVIEEHCRRADAPLHVASPESIDQPLGLGGEHQRQNAACATLVAQLLERDHGFRFDRLSEGLKKTTWPGRLETICIEPHVIVDGAHNPAGGEVLAAYVRTHLVREHTLLMIGMLADKSIDATVVHLVPCFREVIAVRAPSDRGADAELIAAAVRRLGGRVSLYGSAEEGLEATLPKLTSDETLVIAGSLRVVGAAKSFFEEKRHVISSDQDAAAPLFRSLT